MSIDLDKNEKIQLYELFNQDEELKNLINSRKQLSLKKSSVDLILKSMREQLKVIDIETNIINSSVTKGLPISTEIWLKKQNDLKNLKKYLYRLTLARKFKSNEEEIMRKEISNLNKKIKDRREIILNNMLTKLTQEDTNGI